MSGGVGRGRVLLASGTMASRILGFAKAAALTVAIGSFGDGANSFAVATQFPTTITTLIAGGLLNAVLVPQIVRAARAEDGGERYVNRLVSFAILALAVLATALTFCSPFFVDLFNVPPGNRDLAIAFTYWSIPQVFFLGMFTVVGEVLNARRVYGPFTWAPAINNVVGIVAIGAFILIYGADGGGLRASGEYDPGMIAWLAGGATAATAVQALVLTVSWRRTGYRFRFDPRLRGVGFGAAGRAAGWTFAMLIVTQIAGVIQTQVANAAVAEDPFAPGPPVLGYAWLLVVLPHSVVTLSLTVTALTGMSEHAARNDLTAVRREMAATLRSSVVILIPSAIALALAAGPLARMFTADGASAQQMGAVIVAFAVGLVPFSMQYVLSRCFFALGDTRTPFFSTLAQGTIVIVLMLLCAMLPADHIALGIAVSISVSGTLQTLLTALLLRRRVGLLEGRRAVGTFGRGALAGIPAVIVGGAVAWLLGGFATDGFALSGRPQGLLAAAAVGLTTVAVHLVAQRLLREPELDSLMRFLRRRRS